LEIEDCFRLPRAYCFNKDCCPFLPSPKKHIQKCFLTRYSPDCIHSDMEQSDC
jgi:hypothetical protein